MSYEPTVLVTGGAGFIGCNLADHLARHGYRVRILDSLERPGSRGNLDWLQQRHAGRIKAHLGDIRDPQLVIDAVRSVEGVFHFAAQVAVTTSLTSPRDDFEVNLLGTLNVLEALRLRNRHAPLLFASTNKVYGALDDVPLRLEANGYAPTDAVLSAAGLPETRRLDFHTPYGCSKGGADQYVLDYARSYEMRCAVFRMSCIYGPRQSGTEDQGWVAHFLIQALQGRPLTLFGDGWQVRDICGVEDTCAMYRTALEKFNRISGRAFNWGGGPANATSLRCVIDEIEAITGREITLMREDWRAGDQRWFVSDTSAIDKALGLAPRRGWKTGLRSLASWLQEQSDRQSPATEMAAVASPA